MAISTLLYFQTINEIPSNGIYKLMEVTYKIAVLVVLKY